METSDSFRIKDLIIGTGEIAELGTRVKIYCIIQLLNADPVHDEEKIFVLEEGGEAAGLVEGILGMHVGGRRKIEASANWWYGEDANLRGIPSNMGLRFVVDLRAII